LQDNDDEIDFDDDSLLTGYRRRDLDKSRYLKPPQEQELSDYVKIRLLVARTKALEKYREIYSVA